MQFLASLFAGIAALVGSWFSRPAPQAPVAVPAPQEAPASTSTEAGAKTNAPGSAAPAAGAASSTPAPAADALPAGSAWLSALPLGDYQYSTSGPAAGKVYLCHIATGGGGAKGSASWISGEEWYPAEKVAVEGAASWPDASYHMSISGSTRTITSNGEPTDHATGIFPIRKSDPAYQFDANPNTITPQSYDFSFPAYPSFASSPQCIFGEVGIMNDGVPLFDGFDAEYRDALAHETQDAWEGHPDESGVYHNHGFEAGPVKEPVSTVVGFAFDGFPITGSLLPSGAYLHTADLDECHGLTSTITLDGKEVTTYHYVLTQDFPYSVSCFRGASHEPKPGGGQEGAQQRPGQPPPPR
ncbi:MAG TPA: YHYH protein [Candidatus Paceibacterota bacterium]|nr:YHYH protein [Candidatus Paceibacterota bacterium]